jgi:hypothetical protein
MAMYSPKPNTHPAFPDEKSGMDAPCSAAAFPSAVVQSNIASAATARTLRHELKSRISVLP